MKQCGLDYQVEEIQQIIQSTDFMGNGKINYSEFIVATMNDNVYMNEEKLWQAFNFFDTDGTGHITEENLKEAMKKVGVKVEDQAIKDMIKENDLAKDNKISFEEFKLMMSPK